MANGVRINNLNQATSLNDADTITIIQDDENKKASISLLDKDGTYMQSVVNTIPDLITTSKANVETTKQAIDEKFGDDEFSIQIVTSQEMSSVGVSDDGSVDVSSQVQDGFMESAILSGNTLVNLCQFKSTNTTTLNATYEYNDNKYIVTNNGNDGYVKTDITVFLEANKTYTFKAKCDRGFNNSNGYIYLLLNNNISDAKKMVDGNTTFTVASSGIYYIRLDVRASNEPYVFSDLMILEGDYTNVDIPYFEGMQSVKMPILKTTNEDGTKSNTLSTPEEVTLRGIGEVQDTLDCLTGEVTERIGEIVLDGSEDELWSLHQISSYTTHTRFEFSLRNNNKLLGIVRTELKCDRFTWIDGDVETEHIKMDGEYSRSIFVYIQSSKLATQNVNGLKSWLQTNPLTIQYILETPTIKTVDLNSSNGDVKTPIVYKNGHILLQSDGLIPELRYSIPDSYSGLIAQNTMTNLKHSWRLDELEIMAYTSIVNSQYDSLILVATAETNEVLVSSDYVPDESLYNMLKVLVNENALENADEKINVFYLYGKLSDEMYIDLIMGDDM